MTTTRNSGTIDTSEFTSPEHTNWKKHRQLSTEIQSDAVGYRGCFGLAQLIDATNADSWTNIPGATGVRQRTFVPDKTVSWASLVDVPVGYFKTGSVKREVHWATVRPTTLKFGMPSLAAGTETAAYDFRMLPFETAKVSTEDGRVFRVKSPPNTLNPVADTRLFRVFNALEWAMTTTAFAFRTLWKQKRSALAEALEIEYPRDQTLFSFGGGFYDSVAKPYQWMPRAYIAFPENLCEAVFVRATRATGSVRTQPVYSEQLQEAFVNAMGRKLAYTAQFDGRVDTISRLLYKGIPVLSFLLKGDRGEREIIRFFADTCVIRKAAKMSFRAGDVIGEETFDAKMPDDWYSKSPSFRWHQWAVPRLVPDRLDDVMRLWFEREAVKLKDGMVHYPAQIASVAALSSAVDRDLFWEVGDALEYYDDACDALIFPTVHTFNWHELSGSLPGDVAYDLHPTDPRFETYKAQLARILLRPGGAKPKKPRVRPEPVAAKPAPKPPAKRVTEDAGQQLTPAEQDEIIREMHRRGMMPTWMQNKPVPRR